MLITDNECVNGVTNIFNVTLAGINNEIEEEN